jgi:hypothetical protein
LLKLICVSFCFISILAVLSTTASAQSVPVGIQFSTSTLGLGGEVGVGIVPRVNVRGGFHLFNYGHTFHNSGIAYDGTLFLRSASANVDLYLIGPFHISPGVLLYNGLRESAVAAVAGGSTVTLGGITYQSSTASPLNGKLEVTVRRAAPEIMFGFGNFAPRNGKHFTINSDFGVVFQGSPNSTLSLKGLACLPPNSTGPTCVDAAVNPIVVANTRAQQDKLNSDLAVYKYYPVLSFGIGYRF